MEYTIKEYEEDGENLIDIDRLPTMEELKSSLNKHDWTTAQISDPATRTERERAEIAYVATIMDKKFEELAQQKGRPSSAKYYGEDNPLCYESIITSCYFRPDVL